MDRIYKVIIKGYIVQQDSEVPPDNWEWGRGLEIKVHLIDVPFIDTPHVTITKLGDVRNDEDEQEV